MGSFQTLFLVEASELRFRSMQFWTNCSSTAPQQLQQKKARAPFWSLELYACSFGTFHSTGKFYWPFQTRKTWVELESRENMPTTVKGRWRRGGRRLEVWEPRACAVSTLCCAATAQRWKKRGRPAHWQPRKALQVPRAQQSCHNQRYSATKSILGPAASWDAGRLKDQCFTRRGERSGSLLASAPSLVNNIVSLANKPLICSRSQFWNRFIAKVHNWPSKSSEKTSCWMTHWRYSVWSHF